MAFIHQQLQLAFACYGLGEVQAAEFILMRHSRHLAFCNNPVIERALILELQGAQGVGHTFNGILQRMGEGVHRVNTPGIACIMVV
ncbi:hypothetical protein D3C75_1150980 [compost metagenome]